MKIKDFQNTILQWYTIEGRHDLPWRKTQDPYKILVSEVMLQQTQISRVIPKYKEFLKKFPTLRSLANASTQELLNVWKGLGYNRRALYLKKTAEYISANLGGRFPREVEKIQGLPGVGAYTARAVAAFSWNTPEVFIETNIRRVILHFFFPDKEGVADAEIALILQEALYKKDPRSWYWALMDYGAVPLKKIVNPNKRSRHYVKQSRFEGSRRQARARILSLALEKKGGVSIVEFRKYFGADPDLARFKDTSTLLLLLQKLTGEGFLSKRGDRWFVQQ